jgi:hypothetical protein
MVSSDQSRKLIYVPFKTQVIKIDTLIYIFYLEKQKFELGYQAWSNRVGFIDSYLSSKTTFKYNN